MSNMTKTALSDCSYPESTVYNIQDDIDATIMRLKVVIEEEASLRKALRALFVKRREDAIEQVRLANLHLDLVNEEETAFCNDLMKAAASTNEGLEGFGSRDSIKQDETTVPFRMTHGTTGDHSFFKRLTDNGQDEDEPLKNAGSTHALRDSAISPANSTPELCADPPLSPAKSTHRFNSPSPPHSAHSLANEPTETPGGATDNEDIYSIPSLTSSTLARYTRSPAQSTYALERWPRTPQYFTPKLANGPLPISSMHCNGVFYSRDTPRHSPTRSARGLEDDYLYPEATPSQGTPGNTQIPPPASPFGENYISIGEPKNLPALPTAASPTTFAFGSGRFDASPTADTGFGFGVTPTVNTNFGFVDSPLANTAFAFGVGLLPPSTSIDFGSAPLGSNEVAPNHPPREGLDLVYERAEVVGASVGFGVSVDVQDPLPIQALPEELGVVVVMPSRKKKKMKKGSHLNAVTPCEVGSDVQAFVEPLEDVQLVDLNPPEDTQVVAVAPEKPKNGKKKKGFLKAEPLGAVMVPSPLEVYLSKEEASLAHTQSGLNRYKENVKTLLQLIERLEGPATVTTESLQQDSGSQGERTEAEVVQPIENNRTTEEDIAVLKKRLADEEGNVRIYLKFAEEEESRIASYRRLIAASSS